MNIIISSTEINFDNKDDIDLRSTFPLQGYPDVKLHKQSCHFCKQA